MSETAYADLKQKKINELINNTINLVIINKESVTNNQTKLEYAEFLNSLKNKIQSQIQNLEIILKYLEEIKLTSNNTTIIENDISKIKKLKSNLNKKKSIL